jgi:cobalamin biosynthesis Mg chelatase CobN
LQLGLEDWFVKNSPFAMQDAMAAMLEAARKGYWQADPEQLNDLAQRYAANVAKIWQRNWFENDLAELDLLHALSSFSTLTQIESAGGKGDESQSTSMAS